MNLEHSCGMKVYLPADFSGALNIRCPGCGQPFAIDSAGALPPTGKDTQVCPGCDASHDGDVRYCLECGYDYSRKRVVKLDVLGPLPSATATPLPGAVPSRMEVTKAEFFAFVKSPSFRIVRVILIVVGCIAGYHFSGPFIDRMFLEHMGVRSAEQGVTLVRAYRYGLAQEIMCDEIADKFPELSAEARKAKMAFHTTYADSYQRIDAALTKVSPNGEWPEAREKMRAIVYEVARTQVMPVIDRDLARTKLAIVTEQADGDFEDDVDEANVKTLWKYR